MVDKYDPTPIEFSKVAQWQIKDTLLMAWILGFIDQPVIPNKRSSKTAKNMWAYLQKKL